VFYRVRQFIWGITARLTDEEINFINNYLNKPEKSLFFSLPVYDQVHSVRVAKRALEESLNREMYDVMLIKAALLHDIGKINSGLNLITKSILVLADKMMPTLTRRLKGISFVNAYYNHPEIAMDYLAKEDRYIKYLVKNHHNSLIDDEKLKILQIADSEN
jgi:predicted HD phosphohydrolase